MNSSEEYKIIFNKIDKIIKNKLPQFVGPWEISKTKNGQSNPTYILKSKTKSLVLRKKPSGILLKSAHLIEREFKILSCLQKTSLPVPKVYFLNEEVDDIGSSFFIMDYLDGVTFTNPMLPDLKKHQRKIIYESMNKGLADLHSICPQKIGLENYGKKGNYILRQLVRWTEQYELSKTENILEMERLINWLFENLPNPKNTNSIVHGDWRIDNLIFDKKTYKLIGIIDWELSTLGDPIIDLATQLMQWNMPFGDELRGLKGINRNELGLPSDKNYINLYINNRNLTDIPNLKYYIIFSFFRMASILQGVRKRAFEGNASNPEKAIRISSHVKLYATSALDMTIKKII